MKNSLRIGILLTEKEAERKKDELVNIKYTKRPWLKRIFDKALHEKLYVNRKGKACVGGDTSIGFYILDGWDNVEIDFILPTEISEERLHSNCINFMLIYDLLESFHTDKTGKNFEALKKTLKSCKNVYPPIEYQEFINNKCSYIKHLNDNDKSVIDTKCIMNKSMMPTKNVTEKFVNKKCAELKSYIDEKNWGEFIKKPVYGQESIGFKYFKKFDDKIIKKCIKDDLGKYPGIIFQKYIDGFDKESPEIRMYYIGDTYKYSVITTNSKVKIPNYKDENGTLVVGPMEELKRFSKSVVKSLPDINVNGVKLPRLLTRIDISCQKDFAKPWYVNEVEFVPSLYIQDINIIPEVCLGDQMIKIATEFCKKAPHINYV